ncbi:hypothetical protein B0H14DRAFT_2863550 [Mycena olivaceomarginata]|nr:hypothetical protein B0H14DRAFT_2863550 [Mycena olivaceomarginata]
MSLSKICTGLFDGEMATMQRSSRDLVIYSPGLRMPVRVAWPTVNENSVPPLFIAEYLKRVNRFWPCFCSRNTDEHDAVSCRLVIMLRTTTVAVCHYNPPRCQFFLNLDSLSETTSLKAEFAPAGEEDSRSLFLLGTRPAELNYSEWVQGEAIYLSGYLGAAGHQIQQLSVFESTINKYVETPQSHEQQLLAMLAAGDCISQNDAQDLFAGCNNCGAVFLKGYGKGHCDDGLTLLRATPMGGVPI